MKSARTLAEHLWQHQHKLFIKDYGHSLAPTHVDEYTCERSCTTRTNKLHVSAQTHARHAPLCAGALHIISHGCLDERFAHSSGPPCPTFARAELIKFRAHGRRSLHKHIIYTTQVGVVSGNFSSCYVGRLFGGGEGCFGAPLLFCVKVYDLAPAKVFFCSELGMAVGVLTSVHRRASCVSRYCWSTYAN